MTDKQSFLDQLNAALLDRNVSESDIRPYLERFDRFYDRMVSDPNQVGPDVLKDIDTIADNIAAQISERYDEINRLAERTMTLGTVKPEEPEETGYEMAEENAPTELIEASAVEQALDELDAPQPEKTGSTRLPDYIDEEPAPNSTMFWVLFGVSLPVTVPLALAGIGVFIGVWGALILTILASITALVGLVAAGSALSLIGIIYGIIQLFGTMPVGLYEIGLGVIIAGIVMFAGILLYNLAVRLMPFLIRMVGRLFRYLLGKMHVLFNYLRRECAKL